MQEVSFSIHNPAEQTGIWQATICRPITQARLTAAQYTNPMQIPHQPVHQMLRNQDYS